MMPKSPAKRKKREDESAEGKVFREPFGGTDASAKIEVSKIPAVTIGRPKKERPRLSKHEEAVKEMLKLCLNTLREVHKIPR
jgi:hypothetical protein